MRKIGCVLLCIISMAFLTGCIQQNISFRGKCINCDNDLKKWKEDCLPVCRDMEKRSSDYNITIPTGWELSGVQKNEFTYTKIIGSEESSNTISCICVFQKLTQKQHSYINSLFNGTG